MIAGLTRNGSSTTFSPIQPVTAEIDRARRLATVKTKDREIVLRDVPVGENPYNLLQQINAALAQSCQPFVTWRLEWVSGEVDRLWPEGVPQIRNEHGSAYFTGYAHDEAGNLIYLGMVGSCPPSNKGRSPLVMKTDFLSRAPVPNAILRGKSNFPLSASSRILGMTSPLTGLTFTRGQE